MDFRNMLKNSLINQGKQNLTHFIDLGIDGFKYFDKVVNPHIYIPYLNAENKSPQVALNLNDDEILPGFTLNQGIIDSSSMSESVAKNRITFVVAGNEEIDFRITIGTHPSTIFNIPSSASPMGIIQYPNERHIIIDSVKIQNKKEAWGNGRAEVHWVAIHLTPSCMPVNSTNTSIQSNSRMAKISNSELNTWQKTNGSNAVSFPFAGNDWYWNPITEKFGIVIYEKDVRKKFERHIITVPACTYENNIIKTIDKEGEWLKNEWIASMFPLTSYVWIYKDVNGAGASFKTLYRTTN